MITLYQATPPTFNANILLYAIVFSIPCAIAFTYGYLMAFNTDKYLKSKEFNLGYWLHNDSPDIAPRLRRMAQSELWKNEDPTDSRSKTRQLGIFILFASTLAEICILVILLVLI